MHRPPHVWHGIHGFLLLQRRTRHADAPGSIVDRFAQTVARVAACCSCAFGDCDEPIAEPAAAEHSSEPTAAEPAAAEPAALTAAEPPSFPATAKPAAVAAAAKPAALAAAESSALAAAT